jgi:hypothetical protein
MDAVPAALPLVAVIVAVPGATPVTIPVDETVAVADGLELHVTGASDMTFPLASFTTAVSDVVRATMTFAEGGVTVTVAATGAATVTVAVPVCPSLVAVIVDVPALTAVTTPAAETVATAGVPDAHTIARPVSTFPPASFVTALNAAVPPMTKAFVGGDTVTLATAGAETVTLAVPD